MKHGRTIIIAVFSALWLAGCKCAPHSHAGHKHDHGNGHVHSHAHGHHHDHDHVHDLSHERDHALLHPAYDPLAPCTCSSAQLSNGWCRKCNFGYVAGTKIDSATLFETLDPHGHEYQLASLQCPDCRRAVKTNGYCDKCRAGFANGFAYFTRLTHALTFGRPTKLANIKCANCRKLAHSGGWCSACNSGMVGNVEFADRAAYERAAREYAILLRAIDAARRCHICASAMVTHTSCPDCNISYESADAASTPLAAGSTR